MSIDWKELTINERIKRCRRMANLRQEDLAAKLDIKPSTYSQKERSGEISAVLLLKIAEALGVSVEFLLTGEEKVDDTSAVEVDESVITINSETFGEGLRQTNVTPPTPMYTFRETQIFNMIHTMREKDKQEIFDLVQKKYKETKYKK